jgi:hypothetical protein
MDARVIDLTAVSNRLYEDWYRWKWRSNLAGSLMILALGSFFIASALGWGPIGGNPGAASANLVLAAFFLALGGLVLLGANRTYRHSATALTLDSRGLGIQYPGGRSLRIDWANSRFRLKLGAMKSNVLKREIRKAHFLWTPPLFLEMTDADALISAAIRGGLRVNEVKDGNSTTGKSILLTPSPDPSAAGSNSR